MEDTTGYIGGKTGCRACRVLRAARLAASDSDKVEMSHQRPSYAGVSAHDRHKMKKAARASTDRPVRNSAEMAEFYALHGILTLSER